MMSEGINHHSVHNTHCFFFQNGNHRNDENLSLVLAAFDALHKLLQGQLEFGNFFEQDYWRMPSTKRALQSPNCERAFGVVCFTQRCSQALH